MNPPAGNHHVPSQDRTDDSPRLLLVGTGMKEYREYLLRSIAGEYRIHLFGTKEPTWERAYVAGATVIDTLDVEAMTAAARELKQGGGLDGILCWDEARILMTAAVGEALGLRGGDYDVVHRCRDKHLTRRALDAAGVPQPQSIPCATVEQARAAAELVGYPLVCKPRGLGASLGVVKVETPDALESGFAHAYGTRLPDAEFHDDWVLVEEYLDGPEVSIDSACVDGVVTPLFVGRKQLGYPPYFDEVGHVVHGDDPLLRSGEIRDVLQATHTAVGFRDGMTHTELRLTKTGPKIVEINARIGGDLIPYLGLQTTGIDPGLAAADIACGRDPRLTASRARVGAVRFFYPEREMVVGEVRVADTPLPPAVDRVVPLGQPGDTLAPPPKGHLFGRFAYATAVADDEPACLQALDAAQAVLSCHPAREATEVELVEMERAGA